MASLFNPCLSRVEPLLNGDAVPMRRTSRSVAKSVQNQLATGNNPVSPDRSPGSSTRTGLPAGRAVQQSARQEDANGAECVRASVCEIAQESGRDLLCNT